jgi:hypothetical protein
MFSDGILRDRTSKITSSSLREAISPVAAGSHDAAYLGFKPENFLSLE